ncbi:MAG: prepilin-type N-terminal cleavage/methylation domain-containing protein [Alphaproteobacteria bacterium]
MNRVFPLRVKSHQSGFTLLELLVALTLLGLTVAMIVSALNTGLLGADVTAKRSARLNQVRAAQVALRRHIEGARPVNWADNALSKVGFDGRTASARFVSVLPPWPGNGGPHLVSVAHDGDRLVMSRKIHSGENPSFDFSSPVSRTILLEGVKAIRFGYFGPENPRAPAKWHGSWRSRVSLPSLIRLSVTFRGDAGAAWPELIIAPVIGPQPR